MQSFGLNRSNILGISEFYCTFVPVINLLKKNARVMRIKITIGYDIGKINLRHTGDYRGKDW